MNLVSILPSPAPTALSGLSVLFRGLSALFRGQSAMFQRLSALSPRRHALLQRLSALFAGRHALSRGQSARRAARRTLPLLTALLLLCPAFPACAAPPAANNFPLDFSVFRMGTEGPVALVIGGIQGDEPGGFSAATLLAMRYTVHKGTIWVVPNLNFPSIIRSSRGLYGDMNRKFAVLDKADPEFSTVSRIQELIRAPEVELVLNLHDGSGYFRPRREGPLHNPSRWGQSVIIDQSHVAAPESSTGLRHLEGVAQHVAAAVNARLLAPGHVLHVRNTRTAQGDREMEKSLSWYAVRQGKAAFGLEASKEFPVAVRTYYHLLMIESFLAAAGIEAERDFPLTPGGVRAALQSDLTVAFAENRIMLPLDDARPHINLLPLPRNTATGIPSKPIMAVLPDAGTLCVHYGNRQVTRIRPDWRDMDHSLHSVQVMVDGKERRIAFGQVLEVRDSFLVRPMEGYRVNAIGASLHTHDESGLTLRKDHFVSRYSVDRRGTLFRVEVYRGQMFSGLFLVRFGGKPPLTQHQALPSVPRKESALGF